MGQVIWWKKWKPKGYKKGTPPPELSPDEYVEIVIRSGMTSRQLVSQLAWGYLEFAPGNEIVKYGRLGLHGSKYYMGDPK
jgi:hypothetical protein